MRSGTKNLLFALWIFVLVWLIARFLLPLFAPFLLGLALALAAEPLVSFLQRKLRLPRSLCVGLGVSLSFVLLAGLLLLLVSLLARELRSLAGILPDLEQTARSGIQRIQSWLLALSAGVPGSLRPVLQEKVASMFSGSTRLLEAVMEYLLGLAGSFLSHVPDSALSLGTAVLSGFMISARLPRIRRWLRHRIPRERLQALKTAFVRTKRLLLDWLSAQARLMGVTFVILLLGLVILRIPYAPLFAAGISLVDALPVLGTGSLLIPWSLLCLLQGDLPRAVGIAGIYATVTLTRSILEPKLLGRRLGLDPLVTLMAIYAGYKLWGIGGMLLAPLLTVAALRLTPDRRQ